MSVMALHFLGEGDDAMVASEGLLAAADATHNPLTACSALLAHGLPATTQIPPPRMTPYAEP